MDKWLTNTHLYIKSLLCQNIISINIIYLSWQHDGWCWWRGTTALIYRMIKLFLTLQNKLDLKGCKVQKYISNSFQLKCISPLSNWRKKPKNQMLQLLAHNRVALMALHSRLILLPAEQYMKSPKWHQLLWLVGVCFFNLSWPRAVCRPYAFM